MKRKFVLALLASMAIGNAWATDAFRVHRWESFYGLPVTTGNTVFVGNSITNMHDWWEAFGDNQSILNRGTSGGFTYEVLDHLEMIIAGKPAKLFLGIGTNDITAYTPETVSDNIRIIAERIINESPSTQIYVQSVLPSTSGNRNQRNPELNRQIAEKVAALKVKYPDAKLEYVNVFDLFVADNGYSIKSHNGLSLAYDNLHPTVLGYGLWTKHIEGLVGSQSIYDTSVTQMYNGGQNNSTGDRITCFAQQVVNADDVLIIGDEMVSSGEWHELFGSANVKNRGLGWGYTGSQLTQEITNAPIYFQNTKSVAPKAIVVYAGVQEARDNLTAADFKTRYTSLITALRNSKATSEKTQIFLLSPLHTPNAAQCTLIDSYQAQLQALASELDNVHYIDATSLNNAAGENYYVGDGGNYLTSLGYVRLANKIEAALTDELGNLGHNVVTEAQAIANKALYTNRDLVGDALTAALRLQGKEGNGMGQYSDLSALNAPLQAAYTLLASGEITEATATRAKNALSIALPEINQPTSGKYYTLCSVNRGSKYLTSDGTNVVGTGDAKYAKNQWQFVARDNGTFDLINRADGKYLSTAAYDQALTVSTTVPENGWAFTGSNSAGLYNVANGTCEINMTNSDVTGGKKVVNWSKSQQGDDRNDDGCKFQIVEFEGEPEVVPEIPVNGKVYTVYNDHVGTPYYLNDQLTSSCTALTTDKAEDKSQQWIAWGNATDGYKFYNVKNNQILTCNGGVQTLDISSAHALRGVSLRNHGTNQHMAGNKTTLTLKDGKFSADNAQYNEYNNLWSTDFVFTSTGENAYKVEGTNVTVAGKEYSAGSWVLSTTELTSADVTVANGYKAVITDNTITAVEKGDVTIVEERVTNMNEIVAGIKIAMKVNVGGQTNGWFGVPQGSADTKTWYTVEVGSATGTIILKTDDGKYLGTNTSTSALEYVNAAADATNIYLEAEGDGTDNAKYMFKNSAGTTNTTAKALALTNNADLQASWWDRGSAPRIRLEVYKQTEVEKEAAKEYVIADNTGSFGGTGFRSVWTSTATNPQVTVTSYNGNNAANNIKSTTGENAFIVYTGTFSAGSKLTVSVPATHVITGYSFDVAKFDGTNAITLGTPRGSSWSISTTSEEAHSENHSFDDSVQSFNLTLTGANQGLKFSNFKVYVKEVSSQPTTYTISSTTGTLYHTNGSANQSYNAVWKSSKTPQLQFGCGVNNMRYSGTNLELMTGSSGNATYTITAPAGYVITGYSFNYANNNHDTALTLTHDGAITQTARTSKSINVEDVELSSAAFTLEGANGNGLVLSNFVVTIEPFTAKPPVVSTEGDVKWYYIVNASSKNYCHDKVMYYEPDGNSMKFADKSFDARYIWSFWRGDNGKLAIMNYKGEYLGTAGNGTGGGTAFGKSENANYIYNIDEAFGFFTINDGGVPLHAQDANSVIVRWGAEADGASLWRFEKADITNANAALSTTLVQQGKVSTGRGNKNVPIVRSTMKVSGLEGNVTFSGVKGKVTGTNLADITKVQAYFATDNRELYVADSRMEWRNSNAVLYGTAASIGADGQFTITGENKTLEPGNYYLWLTLDVAENATEGNTVDAQITGYTIDGAEAPEANGNPQYEATVFLSEGTVLMAGDGKFRSKYFRIPAITTTADGKRLVTLTDDRLNHNGDLPSHVYITAQYSDDNGQTWSEPKIVAGEEATGGNYGHGDAQIITNRVNGDIVGIMTCATNGQGFFGSTPERPQTWKTIISHDNGETWTVPVDHTKELYAAGSPNPLWQGGFSGSGAGLQKRDGTLVSPFVCRDGDGKRQFVLFESVDAGESWHVAGNPCMINEADEPKVLERNNGDLAISVRASNRNFHNETSDNGLTWNHPVNTRFTTGISGNACDGEYMVWCSTLDGNERNIAFQTVPNNGSRQNVSIALSLDEGDTFEAPKTICPRGSAYSAATVLADGTLGVYYEENGVNDGYTMRFVRFSLDWASDHKYGFTAEKPYKRYTSLQAIVNAILRNIYQSVTISNATDEIKRLNEVQR